MLSQLLRWIKYRKERVRLVQKNGKTYVKYSKVRRFKLSRDAEYTGFAFLIMGVLGMGVVLLVYEVLKIVLNWGNRI